MSGGCFDYQQYRINDIADEIDKFLANPSEIYSSDIILKFRETAHELRRVAEMAQRIDWLISGEDGEDSFRARWKMEVRPKWEENQ